jgi:hypothetical protein
MDDAAPSEQDVSCPHCKKDFAALLLSGAHARGFKCPHCRLFVPLERRREVAWQPSPRRAPRHAPTTSLNQLTGHPDSI